MLRSACTAHVPTGPHHAIATCAGSDPALSLLAARPELAAQLTPYLSALRVDDIALLTSHGLIDGAAPHDRPAMEVAVKRFLSPHLPKGDPAGAVDGFGRLRSPPVDLAKEATRSGKVTIADGFVDLSSLVTPSRFHSAGAVRLGTVPIDQVDEVLEVIADRMEGAGLAGVTGVGVKGAYLQDGDVRFIVQLVSKLPHCQRVDMSNNHFAGSDVFWDCLHVLLSLQPVERVIATYNPALHVSHKADIRDLAAGLKTVFAKLIWIYPEETVEHGRWSTWLGDSDEAARVADTVREAHKAYYTEYNAARAAARSAQTAAAPAGAAVGTGGSGR